MFAPWPPALTHEADVDRLLQEDMIEEAVRELVPSTVDRLAALVANFAIVFALALTPFCVAIWFAICKLGWV